MEYETLQTKGRGLRVNAVGAARAGRVSKVDGTVAQNPTHALDTRVYLGGGVAYL